MAGVKTLGAQFNHTVTIVEQVNEFAAGQVATLEQNPAIIFLAKQPVQAFASARHFFRRLRASLVEQRASLWQIRREYARQGQQRVPQ